MDVISYAIRFWSKGEMAATFLRHEGFLGVMGAFLKGHPLQLPADREGGPRLSGEGEEGLRAQFVERFAMGSPFSGGTIIGRPFSTLSEKVSWVERFVEVRPARLRPSPDLLSDSVIVADGSQKVLY
jgi:bifunctional damage-control phosphatase, subfamily II, fusion protein